MFRYVFALAILGAVVTPVRAQDVIPDLKGTWTGKGKSIVFGNNAHHAGKQTIANPPRVRDIEAIHVVDGQDGRLVWGRSSSAAASTKEPFAWAIASDNKSIVGADMDGYFGFHFSRPIAWRSVTRRTRHARAVQLSLRVRSWNGRNSSRL